MTDTDTTWVRRRLLIPSSGNIGPLPIDLRESGYGYRIVLGGHYVKHIDTLSERELSATPASVYSNYDTHPGDTFDGAIRSHPTGFAALRIHGARYVPQGTDNPIALVVIDILKVPAAIAVQESGLGAMGSIKLMAGNVHAKPGVGSLVIPGSQSRLAASSAGAYGYRETFAGVNQGFQSRQVGDDDFAWFPAPDL